jgi:hypothetical protein
MNLISTIDIYDKLFIARWIFFFNLFWCTLVWLVPLAQVWTNYKNRETQHVNIVLQCMYRFFELPNMKGNHAWKSLETQYLPHSESKSYQINSIKSCSSRSFQQHQNHNQIPQKFSATMQFNFQWRNHSIFKNFCTASPKVMQPSPCTPPRQ